MITKEELKEYSKLMNLNLGQAEKDYFQNIFLFIISQEYGNELVFKGGTALKKCFGLDRFSEDLDFSCREKVNFEKIEIGIKRFNIEYEFEKKEYERGLKLIFRLKGPLYVGVRSSLCRIEIDISFRENILKNPIIKNIGRFLNELPSFEVLVMSEEEILAEKIRAIMSRELARDVYDLWFLLNKGTKIDMEFIKNKLKYYNEEFDKNKFRKKLSEKKIIWKTELIPLLKKVPDFVEVKNYILKEFKFKEEGLKN